MIDKIFVLMLDRASAEQINSVQEIVKEHAEEWWHNLDNVWLIGSDATANVWRDLLKPILKGTGASVLVLRLPAAEIERNWSFFGPNGKERCSWIYEHYKARMMRTSNE